MKPVLVGVLLVAMTVVVHAIGTAVLVGFLNRRNARRGGLWPLRAIVGTVVLAATLLLLLHFIEVMLWAGTYLLVLPAGELASFEEAAYFSLVTFTTLGYGDVTLSSSWRVLSGIEALNGILLVGWSTALLFAVLQRVWQHHRVAAE